MPAWRRSGTPTEYRPRALGSAVEPAFGGSYRSDDLSATAACEPRPYRAIGRARERPQAPVALQVLHRNTWPFGAFDGRRSTRVLWDP